MFLKHENRVRQNQIWWKIFASNSDGALGGFIKFPQELLWDTQEKPTLLNLKKQKCAMCVKLNNFNSNIKINRLASNSKDEPNLVGTFTWDTISIKTSTWKDFKRQIKSCRSFFWEEQFQSKWIYFKRQTKSCRSFYGRSNFN